MSNKDPIDKRGAAGPSVTNGSLDTEVTVKMENASQNELDLVGQTPSRFLASLSKLDYEPNPFEQSFSQVAPSETSSPPHTGQSGTGLSQSNPSTTAQSSTTSDSAQKGAETNIEITTRATTSHNDDTYTNEPGQTVRPSSSENNRADNSVSSAINHPSVVETAPLTGPTPSLSPKPMLPPVASIDLPSPAIAGVHPTSGAGFGWDSLRFGPLSPNMLQGPREQPETQSSNVSTVAAVDTPSSSFTTRPPSDASIRYSTTATNALFAKAVGLNVSATPAAPLSPLTAALFAAAAQEQAVVEQQEQATAVEQQQQQQQQQQRQPIATSALLAPALTATEIPTNVHTSVDHSLTSNRSKEVADGTEQLMAAAAASGDVYLLNAARNQLMHTQLNTNNGNSGIPPGVVTATKDNVNSMPVGPMYAPLPEMAAAISTTAPPPAGTANRNTENSNWTRPVAKRTRSSLRKQQAASQTSSNDGQPPVKKDGRRTSKVNLDHLPEDEREKRRSFLERNRIAALKCRQRKKAWLQQLQDRIEYMNEENDMLQQQITALRDEIVNLKTLLVSHKNCPIARANGVNGLDAAAGNTSTTTMGGVSNDAAAVGSVHMGHTFIENNMAGNPAIGLTTMGMPIGVSAPGMTLPFSTSDHAQVRRHQQRSHHYPTSSLSNEPMSTVNGAMSGGSMHYGRR